VARELSGVEQDRSGSAESNKAGLSEREVEVARLVLDGRTHKEIGAQLYISPKTVEHHVARIRVKVGANDRAEFVAALKSLLNS
jgi:DNA-binding CsgD family transcriptional regulator